MKLNMKRLVAMALAFAMVISSLTPSYASAAKNSDEIMVEAEVVETETTEVSAESEVEDVLKESALSSTVVTTVDVAECAMTQEEAEEATEAALGDSSVGKLTDVTYTTDEEGTVTEINVVSDASLAKAAAEIDAIAEGDTTSELTREQVLEKYAQLQYFYESCPQYFGAPVPYFVEKGPINSLLAVIAWGMQWDYVGVDLDGDGNIEMSLDMVAMVIDGYMQVLYVCVNGDSESGLPSMVPKLKEAADDALEQIDSSMTTEEKMLALNDWLANWCMFDMAQIENGDAEKTEQENFAYMIETTLFGGLVGADYMFGGTGVPKTICMGYTAAYTYLVQRAFPEIYLVDGNAANWEDPANWKTKQQLNDSVITTTEEQTKEVQATDEAGNPKYELATAETLEENKVVVIGADGNPVPSTTQKLDQYGKPEYELATDDSVNVISVQNENGEQVYAEDGTALFYDTDKPVMEPQYYDTTKPVMTTVTEQVQVETPNTPTYIIDFVQIKWDADVTMLGEDKAFDETHFFNAVRVDNTSDTWYYIDPCYNDIYVECMGRNRVETDGNMTHSYFLISHTSLAEQFDGNFEAIDTLYAEKATDTKYEEEWFTSTTGPIVKDSNYYYYVVNSSIQDASVSDENFDISNLLNGEDCLMARNRKTGEEIILLDYTSGEGTTTGGTAITGVDALMAAEAEDMASRYSSVTHSVAISGSTLYLNSGNIIFTYDLSSGEIKPFKEYNVVSAAQDTSNPFVGMSFSIVANGSDSAVRTVENHPLAAITIKTDGKLYASVATNFAKASSYEVEETNYNRDYVNYGGFSNGGDNDNDEFLWSANFTESIDLGCSHSYETVEVAASCLEGAYTESRCTKCGVIQAGTKTAVEGSEATGHHYVKHNETYYTEAEEGANVTGVAYVCVDCLDAHEELPEGATLDHRFVADSYTWSEDHGECTANLVCDTCSVRALDCVKEDTTNNKTVACTVTKEYAADYECTRGGDITYTATWTDGTATDTTSETVRASAGTHVYDAGVYTWSEDLSTCSVVFTCQVCKDTNGNPTTATPECTVTSAPTNPTCILDGKTVYTATCTLDGVTRTDSKEVVHAALGHVYDDTKCIRETGNVLEDGTKEICGAGKPSAQIAFVKDASTVSYNAKAQSISADTVEVTKGSGEVTFTYYVDEDCTIPTFQGEKNEGSAPTDTGAYYVKATVAADDNFREATTGETYVFKIRPRKVASVKVENMKSTIKISWAKRAEADGYLILRRKYGTDSSAYKVIKTITKNSTLSYSDGNISQGQRYIYTIKAYSNAEDGTQVEGLMLTTAKQIVRTKVTSITNKNGSVQVKWTQVPDAKGYEIYRKSSGESKYNRITTIKKGTTTSYTDKSSKAIKNCKASYYYVKPYYANKNSSVVLTTDKKTNYYVSRPTISSVSGSSKAFTVKWKKNSSANGYQIQYSTSSSFKNAKTVNVTSKNTVSKKISKLTKNKKYYVKVRTYKTYNSTKYYSAWSGYKSVKTK